MWDKTAILQIGTTYSRCSACGRNADPYETAHTMLTMIGEGCGAVFTGVTPVYLGIEDMEAVIKMTVSVKQDGKNSS